MTEMPPILSGSTQQQIAALRDYLVRLSRTLDSAESAAVTYTQEDRGRTAVTAASAAGSGSTQGVEQLRALITKTARTVERQVEILNQSLREDYLAKSDFGEYAEQIDTLFTATARQVVESYDYESRINALISDREEMERHIMTLRGEICRGLIEDPDTGESALGIAISESLCLTGETVSKNGIEYYCLTPGQTLGIYTSSGWQFWINGAKKGWFDSRDGMLHVGSIAVEESLLVGADWQLSCAGGLGIRYLK